MATIRNRKNAKKAQITRKAPAIPGLSSKLVAQLAALKAATGVAKNYNPADEADLAMLKAQHLVSGILAKSVTPLVVTSKVNGMPVLLLCNTMPDGKGGTLLAPLASIIPGDPNESYNFPGDFRSLEPGEALAVVNEAKAIEATKDAALLASKADTTN